MPTCFFIGHTKGSASIFEERKLLQHIVSLGVGYRYGRSGLFKAAISDTDTLHRQISRTLSLQKYSDVGNIVREVKDRIRNEDNGYYWLDLHKGRILAGGQYPIEDIIIDFTLLGAEDRVLLRRRKGTYLHSTGFLITPNAVYFLGMNRACVPLKEFHMLSFITVDDGSKSGFVVDYDVTQNNKPVVLFPYEENLDIIQAQLNHDDRCWTAERESFIGNIGLYQGNI